MHNGNDDYVKSFFIKGSASHDNDLLVLKFPQLLVQWPPSQCYTDRCKSPRVPEATMASFRNGTLRASHSSHGVAAHMHCVHRCTPLVRAALDSVDVH